MHLYGKINRNTGPEGDLLGIGRESVAGFLYEFDREQVYAVYVLAPGPFDPTHLATIAAMTADGLVDAGTSARYSEITGYLWTDEDGMIGGHDMLDLFSSHVGKYALLIVQREPIDLLAWSPWAA